MIATTGTKSLSTPRGGEGTVRWGPAVMALRARTTLARSLRRDGTEAERRLWRALRECGLPWKFRRQHPIGRRIADLACPACKLVTELDGGQHDTQRTADAARSAEIEAHGYRVIRFWNNEVIDNLAEVLQSIRAALEGPPPHPAPLRPVGRRGRIGATRDV